MSTDPEANGSQAWLDIIIGAAGDGCLGLARSHDLRTGERVTLLVVVVDNEDEDHTRVYPFAAIPYGDLCARYATPEWGLHAVTSPQPNKASRRFKGRRTASKLVGCEVAELAGTVSARHDVRVAIDSSATEFVDAERAIVQRPDAICQGLLFVARHPLRGGLASTRLGSRERQAFA